MLVTPNIGLPTLLSRMLRADVIGFSDFVLMLWANDIEPDQSTVFSLLTPATFNGYNPIVMDRTLWTVPTIVDDQATTTWGTVPFEWTCSGAPQTVYGYAAFDPSSFALLIVERFDEPRDVDVGLVLGVLPRFQLGTFVPCL